MSAQARQARQRARAARPAVASGSPMGKAAAVDFIVAARAAGAPRPLVEVYSLAHAGLANPEAGPDAQERYREVADRSACALAAWLAHPWLYALGAAREARELARLLADIPQMGGRP